MPRIETKRGPKPPAGFEHIREQLEKFKGEMEMAIAADERLNGVAETLWGVTQTDFRRTRFLFEEFQIRHAISRELYDWCLRMGYGNAALAKHWLKPGYGRLCCLRCASSSETSFGTVCACRVPSAQRRDKSIEVNGCRFCGCHGCGQGPALVEREEREEEREEEEEKEEEEVVEERQKENNVEQQD